LARRQLNALVVLAALSGLFNVLVFGHLGRLQSTTD